MPAPSSSDRTSNEISGGAQIGGNAYQAKHMHFGGRSIGLTVVGLAAVGALTYVAVNGGVGTKPEATAAAAQSPTATSAPPSPSPSRSAKAKETTGTPKAEDAAAPEKAKPEPAPQRMTPSVPYSGQHIYCSDWRSSPPGSNLEVSACTQVTGSDAAFGVRLKNVGKGQITVDMTMKYQYGTTLDCPGGYTTHGIRIDPGKTWYSNLGSCSVPDLKRQTNFQAAAYALETSDPDASLNIGGLKFSPTAVFDKDGELRCKSGSTWDSCDTLWPYRPTA
ncbi:hypothetical protein [Streptomyces sp. LaPpAH-108]|uniref:hypothetical protein n=1 Tax=Streptomyces sp. LaPpAH-108 TaxID=1155714 RepID=UPI00035FF841|nr:hypothetical protein [Streptomyces sp. LaPpAH-108]